MQWLRHTRYEPPSIAEQRADIVRQERMKILAAEADARWAAKPSALDAPDKQQPVQMLESRDPRSGIQQMNVTEESKVESELPGNSDSSHSTGRASKSAKSFTRETKDSPFKQPTASNPGDEWQPQSWPPAPSKR